MVRVLSGQLTGQVLDTLGYTFPKEVSQNYTRPPGIKVSGAERFIHFIFYHMYGGFLQWRGEFRATFLPYLKNLEQ